MLILILIDVQYLQNLVFSFEKGSDVQNPSLSDSHQQNFPSKKKKSPLNTTRKTLMMGDIHLSSKLKKYALINAFYVIIIKMSYYIYQNVCFVSFVCP